jgi:hypothetical protein
MNKTMLKIVDHDVRRVKFAEAAMSLIAQHGPEGVTIRAVAALIARLHKVDWSDVKSAYTEGRSTVFGKWIADCIRGGFYKKTKLFEFAMMMDCRATKVERWWITPSAHFGANSMFTYPNSP